MEKLDSSVSRMYPAFGYVPAYTPCCFAYHYHYCPHGPASISRSTSLFFVVPVQSDSGCTLQSQSQSLRPPRFSSSSVALETFSTLCHDAPRQLWMLAFFFHVSRSQTVEFGVRERFELQEEVLSISSTGACAPSSRAWIDNVNS
jgi:hypothetical protein